MPSYLSQIGNGMIDTQPAIPHWRELVDYLRSTTHIQSIDVCRHRAGLNTLDHDYIIRPVEIWLPKWSAWMRADGSSISFDIQRDFACIRPWWFARWRIRRAVRTWAMARNIWSEINEC